MSATAPPHPIPANLIPGLLRVTADQYHTMIGDGAIPNPARYELLDGYIVHKDRARVGGDPMGQDPIHIFAVNQLTQLASRINDGTRYMQLQVPIALTPLYEPEPDAAIVRGTPNDYRKRLVTPADVSCVFEAAHSSLARDSETKLAACAAAGIPQYIILNLQFNTVEIHTQPDTVAASYRTKTTVAPGQSFSIELPNNERLTLLVSDILP